jgi:hypothetical protein
MGYLEKVMDIVSRNTAGKVRDIVVGRELILPEMKTAIERRVLDEMEGEGVDKEVAQHLLNGILIAYSGALVEREGSRDLSRFRNAGVISLIQMRCVEEYLEDVLKDDFERIRGVFPRSFFSCSISLFLLKKDGRSCEADVYTLFSAEICLLLSLPSLLCEKFGKGAGVDGKYAETAGLGELMRGVLGKRGAIEELSIRSGKEESEIREVLERESKDVLERASQIAVKVPQWKRDVVGRFTNSLLLVL